MAQLNLKVSREQLQELKGYAARRRVPVSWLVKDYIDYLLRGGPPVPPALSDLPSAIELAGVAEVGGAFGWLAQEPDLYSFQDGEAL